MCESHNGIILKHENILKDVLSMSVYLTKNESFQHEIDSKVDSALFMFTQSMNKQLVTKVEKDEFYDKIREKASMTDLATLQLELAQQKEQIKVMNQVLEQKADEEKKIPTATLDEFDRLDREKANRDELEKLRMEISRLESIVNRMEDDFTEGEGFSEELENEESEEEVLSLGEIDQVPTTAPRKNTDEAPLDETPKPDEENKTDEVPKPDQTPKAEEINKESETPIANQNEDLKQEEKHSDKAGSEKSQFSRTVKVNIKLDKDFPQVSFLSKMKI